MGICVTGTVNTIIVLEVSHQVYFNCDMYIGTFSTQHFICCRYFFNSAFYML